MRPRHLVTHATLHHTPSRGAEPACLAILVIDAIADGRGLRTDRRQLGTRRTPSARASFLFPVRRSRMPARPGNPPAPRAWWRRRSLLPRLLLAAAAVLLLPTSAFAQASPWENAVDVLRQAFTGPIARGLSLVAIVIGGLAFAYGEGQSKRLIAGIVFGVGMAIGAVNFMAWLFP